MSSLADIALVSVLIVTGHCVNLSKTETNCSCKGEGVSQAKFGQNVSYPCSWYDCGEINWICDAIPPDYKFKCSSNHTLSILACHCVTYDDSENVIEMGKCMYNTVRSPQSLIPYKALPSTEDKINEVMCKQFNRNGTLCSRCRDGYYPLAYSFDMTCVKCPNAKNNWWKFVLIAFLPLTVFCFIILLFKVSIISSYLHGFFYFSQAISVPLIARAAFTDESTAFFLVPFRLMATIYGVWNLDFFRSLELHICLGTDMLQTLALDLAVGVYPLFLMMLTYVLIDLYDRNFKPLVIIWKPFRAIFRLFQENWEVRTSLIDAFATFMFLLNAKFLSVSFDLLTPVQVHRIKAPFNYSVSWRWFFNASEPYFGERHLPYAIMGIAVFALFWLLPTFLVIVYPFCWFQKLISVFPFRWYILHTFMDSFYGCYKDGTQPGTRDYRWFASTFFILRFLVNLMGVSTFNMMYFPLAAILLVTFSIFIVILDPFKDSRNTVLNIVFLLLLALCYVSLVGFTEVHSGNAVFFIWALCLSAFLPACYMSALTLQWMYKHKKFGSRLFRRFYAWRNGYELLE